MSILIFIAVLFLLILIHEWGHYITAKKAGIRVDEFGIGFPPRIWGKKRGETLFSINALPFGGFVKIFGENPDHESLYGPDKERSFIHKPKWVQALVLGAGIISHVLVAWLLLVITLSSGMRLPVTEEYKPYLQSPEEVTVAQVIPNSPAERAGLKPQDKIIGLSVGEDTLYEPTPESVPQFVAAHENEEIALSYESAGVEMHTAVRPQVILVGEERQAAIGMVLTSTATVKLPVWTALWEAGELTYRLFVATAFAIASLLVNALSFSADLSQVAGPIGIVGLVGGAASEGIASLLTFVAILSINLAIINLVPIPSLDGGRLLFVAIEAIKGSPIKPVIANALNIVGFGLIILLIIAVTYNDIIRIIQT